MKYLTCIFCMICGVTIEAQICDFHGEAIEIEGQSTLNTFGSSSTLEYFNQVLIINGEELEVEELDDLFFENRAELDVILGCSFPLGKDFYESISGKIKAFDLDAVANDNGIQKLDYITFDQYGREFKFVMINRTYLYEFVNSVTHILQPAIYYEEGLIGAQLFEYIPPSELSGEFTLISEAIFETVTEQVLVSDAYSELTVVPAVFETAYHYYYSELSECSDAIIEMESTNFISQEEYFELEAVSAELATYTELKLDIQAYNGPSYFKREIINLDSLKQVYVKRLVIESMKEDCYNLNFIRCANYVELKDSTIAVSEVGNAYLPCPSVYKSAGEYCFNQELEVPATYKQRDYLKLVTPAITISTVIEAEFNTVEISTVINKEDLDESCITYSYDSIPYYKLVSPPTVMVTNVPATYGTVTYSLLYEHPVFEAVESDEQVQTIMIDADENIIFVEDHLNLQTVDLSCMHETIKSRMVELSLAAEADEIYSKEYYQAIIEYQQSQKIEIGAVDKTLLESLNISFE